MKENYIYPNVPEIIGEIVQEMVSATSGTIDLLSTAGGVTTISTDAGLLQPGQQVVIAEQLYTVIEVTHLGFDVDGELPIGLVGSAWELYVSYDFGHLKEINDKINSPDAQLSLPMVWLMLDVQQSQNLQPPTWGTASVRIAIIAESERDIDAGYRLNNTFANQLEPLRMKFEKALYSDVAKKYLYLAPGERFEIDSYNRYFYGSADKNKNTLGATITDAIELSFEINLRANKQCKTLKIK